MQEIDIPERAGKYRIVRVISYGSYSTIAVGIDEKEDDVVAIKIIDRKKAEELDVMKYIDIELRLLERLDHPNFAKVYDIKYTTEFIMIFMEYLPNGNVLEFIQNRIHFSQKERLEMCIKILEGINYLHEHGIAHRDIKPENICFDAWNNPKIIDFGLSIENFNQSETYCGTILYMAPEVVECNNYEATKVDIWAFGITMHILISHEYPFEITSDVKHVRNLKTKSLKLMNVVSGNLGALINKCLQFDPELRPTAKDLLTQMRAIYNLLFPMSVSQKVKFIAKSSNKIITPSHTKRNLSIMTSGNLFLNYRLRRVISF